MIGLKDYNNEQIEHGQKTLTYLEYVGSGSFLEATMENWENDFFRCSHTLF
jgi:hypothetical protein